MVYKGMHSRSTFPILRTTYPNNFLLVAKMFSLCDGLEWVDVRDKWDFGAGSLRLYI